MQHFIGEITRPQIFSSGSIEKSDRPIGEGGWTFVYPGKIKATSMDIIFKQLRPGKVSNELQKELANSKAFLENVQVKINEPGEDLAKFQGLSSVVTVLGSTSDTSILVQKKIDGQNLEEAWGSPKEGTFYDKNISGYPSDLSEAKQKAVELISALLAIHSAGMAHCDIKPKNLMLDAEGHIRIIDLGLLKPIGQAFTGVPFNDCSRNAGPEYIVKQWEMLQTQGTLKRLNSQPQRDQQSINDCQRKIDNLKKELRVMKVSSSLDIFSAATVLPGIFFGTVWFRDEQKGWRTFFDHSQPYLRAIKGKNNDERMVYFLQCFEDFNRRMQRRTRRAYSAITIERFSKLIAQMADPNPEGRPCSEEIFKELTEIWLLPESCVISP